MDQKMKNFDRGIEQMMNESAVAPPFGMWNRISAQLDAEVAVAAKPAASPVPQRSLTGMVIGALIIGASLVTAYVVNSTDNNNNRPSAITATAPVVVAPAIATPVTTPAISQQQPVLVSEVKPTAIRSSKPKTIAKPVEEKVTIAEETASVSATHYANDIDLLIPVMPVSANTATNDTYFFPAVDSYTGEGNKTENKAIAKVVKTEKAVEREVTTSSEPRIKFRPKKHNKHSYGKINRTSYRKR
ncbi:MAG TPA: hypothetical protein VK154_01790 [Chitinophagales bacterium]|nr:hypothetical protein [Chitinophagales bacterium]